MLPLNLTDVALTAAPIPSKSGLPHAAGGGEFTVVFDLLIMPEGGDSPLPADPEGVRNALPPAVETDPAIALQEVAAPEKGAPDPVPTMEMALAQPLANPLPEDVGPDINVAPKAEMLPQHLQSTGKVPVPDHRTAPQASLAQTLFEGRFLPQQLVAKIPQPLPVIPAAAVPQVPKGPDPQVMFSTDSDPITTGVPQQVRTDAQSPPSSAAVPVSTALGQMAMPAAPALPFVSLPARTNGLETATPTLSSGAEMPIQVGTQPDRQGPETRSPDLPTSRSALTDKPAAETKQTQINAAPQVSGTKTPESENTPAKLVRAEPLLEMAQVLGLTEKSAASVNHPAATAAPASAGAETARHVAGQISVAMTGQAGRATEIALNPEELGRVRLRMTSVDQSITLHILAERPETNDLLRRHIDVLAQEFRALGYDSVAFSFGGGKDAGNTDGDANGGFDSLLPDQDEEITDSNLKQISGPLAGLDLRL